MTPDSVFAMSFKTFEHARTVVVWMLHLIHKSVVLPREEGEGLLSANNTITKQSFVLSFLTWN